MKQRVSRFHAEGVRRIAAPRPETGPFEDTFQRMRAKLQQDGSVNATDLETALWTPVASGNTFYDAGKSVLEAGKSASLPHFPKQSPVAELAWKQKF